MYQSGAQLIDAAAVLRHVGVDKGWHVADLGCGALGHFVFPAAELVGGAGKVYAVDIQRLALERIQKQAKVQQLWNVIPVWSDIDVVHAARIPNRSLDLTLVADNLYLSENRSGLVKEAIRLTKPGGKILVIEWKRERPLIGPPVERRLTVEEAESCFRDAELKKIDSFEAGDHHFAITFQRLNADPMTEILSVSYPTS